MIKMLKHLKVKKSDLIKIIVLIFVFIPVVGFLSITLYKYFLPNSVYVQHNVQNVSKNNSIIADHLEESEDNAQEADRNLDDDINPLHTETDLSENKPNRENTKVDSHPKKSLGLGKNKKFHKEVLSKIEEINLSIENIRQDFARIEKCLLSINLLQSIKEDIIVGREFSVKFGILSDLLKKLSLKEEDFALKTFALPSRAEMVRSIEDSENDKLLKVESTCTDNKLNCILSNWKDYFGIRKVHKYKTSQIVEIIRYSQSYQGMLQEIDFCCRDALSKRVRDASGLVLHTMSRLNKIENLLSEECKADFKADE